jgi:hypothetical protein
MLHLHNISVYILVKADEYKLVSLSYKFTNKITDKFDF